MNKQLVKDWILTHPSEPIPNDANYLTALDNLNQFIDLVDMSIRKSGRNITDACVVFRKHRDSFKKSFPFIDAAIDLFLDKNPDYHEAPMKKAELETILATHGLKIDALHEGAGKFADLYVGIGAPVGTLQKAIIDLQNAGLTSAELSHVNNDQHEDYNKPMIEISSFWCV